METILSDIGLMHGITITVLSALCSDCHGKMAVDLAWHPVMKEALQTVVINSSLNQVSFHFSSQLSLCHATCHSGDVPWVQEK